MSKFELPPDTKLASKVITENAKNDMMKTQLGWLGRFFGNSSQIKVYIVGLIAIIILLIAVIYTLLPSNWHSAGFGVKEFWTAITPILTTIIGYLIGANTGKNDE
jgi:hypothetical protein